MIRHAFAGALALVLTPLAVEAQTTLTIEASSIDVLESAAVTAPVIGHVQRGRVLEVMRANGDWVTVVWPDSPTGVGHVRLTIGALANTDGNDESWINDVRAQVEAVERAIFDIWAARTHSTTAFHDEPSR